MGEFDLIARHFDRPAPEGVLGVGDDAALLAVAPGHELAVSKDLLLQGRHFLEDTDPAGLGHKSLAVNLSDLGAMGASPLGCLLGLALPRPDEVWLTGFAAGLHALADASGCPLVGGDTTGSDDGIVISVTVLGQVPAGRALRRDAARPGDDIWVSGALGAPDIALRLLLGQLPPDAGRLAACRPALERPQPPWRLGPALIGVAHAAIDLSDGLLQDLGHVLRASACGATLHAPALPEDEALAGLPASLRREAVLSGGETYQLCFTVPPARADELRARAGRLSCRITRIGSIEARPGLRVLDEAGREIATARAGFDHFRS